MESKTTIKWIDGKEYRIELVEPEFKNFDEYQIMFASNFDFETRIRFCRRARTHGFYSAIHQMCYESNWEQYLISEARKRGFISGCTIKTATDMDVMKSGRLQLIGLSKLATEGRKSIIIYDNGKWVAEAKKNYWTKERVKFFNSPTWVADNSLTREEMSQIKCEPEKNIDEVRKIIGVLTNGIDQGFEYIAITTERVKLIREILNDYLNK